MTQTTPQNSETTPTITRRRASALSDASKPMDFPKLKALVAASQASSSSSSAPLDYHGLIKATFNALSGAAEEIDERFTKFEQEFQALLNEREYLVLIAALKQTINDTQDYYLYTEEDDPVIVINTTLYRIAEYNLKKQDAISSINEALTQKIIIATRLPEIDAEYARLTSHSSSLVLNSNSTQNQVAKSLSAESKQIRQKKVALDIERQQYATENSNLENEIKKQHAIIKEQDDLIRGDKHIIECMTKINSLKEAINKLGKAFKNSPPTITIKESTTKIELFKKNYDKDSSSINKQLSTIAQNIQSLRSTKSIKSEELEKIISFYAQIEKFVLNKNIFIQRKNDFLLKKIEDPTFEISDEEKIEIDELKSALNKLAASLAIFNADVLMDSDEIEKTKISTFVPSINKLPLSPDKKLHSEKTKSASSASPDRSSSPEKRAKILESAFSKTRQFFRDFLNLSTKYDFHFTLPPARDDNSGAATTMLNQERELNRLFSKLIQLLRLCHRPFADANNQNLLQSTVLNLFLKTYFIAKSNAVNHHQFYAKILSTAVTDLTELLQKMSDSGEDATKINGLLNPALAKVNTSLESFKIAAAPANFLAFYEEITSKLTKKSQMPDESFYKLLFDGISLTQVAPHISESYIKNALKIGDPSTKGVTVIPGADQISFRAELIPYKSNISIVNQCKGWSVSLDKGEDQLAEKRYYPNAPTTLKLVYGQTNESLRKAMGITKETEGVRAFIPEIELGGDFQELGKRFKKIIKGYSKDASPYSPDYISNNKIKPSNRKPIRNLRIKKLGEIVQNLYANSDSHTDPNSIKTPRSIDSHEAEITLRRPAIYQHPASQDFSSLAARSQFMPEGDEATQTDDTELSDDVTESPHSFSEYSDDESGSDIDAEDIDEETRLLPQQTASSDIELDEEEIPLLPPTPPAAKKGWFARFFERITNWFRGKTEEKPTPAPLSPSGVSSSESGQPSRYSSVDIRDALAGHQEIKPRKRKSKRHSLDMPPISESGMPPLEKSDSFIKKKFKKAKRNIGKTAGGIASTPKKIIHKALDFSDNIKSWCSSSSSSIKRLPKQHAGGDGSVMDIEIQKDNNRVGEFIVTTQEQLMTTAKNQNCKDVIYEQMLDLLLAETTEPPLIYIEATEKLWKPIKQANGDIKQEKITGPMSMESIVKIYKLAIDKGCIPCMHPEAAVTQNEVIAALQKQPVYIQKLDKLIENMAESEWVLYEQALAKIAEPKNTATIQSGFCSHDVPPVVLPFNPSASALVIH